MKKVLALLLAASLAVSALAACGAPAAQSSGTAQPAQSESGSSAPEQGEPIKVGVMACWTGVPLCATEQERGTQMAADEINAAGGVLGRQIEFIIEDSGNTTDMAINVFNKFKSKDIAAIVGPQFSSQAMALDTAMKEAGIPVISNATSPKTIALGNQWLFRVRPSDAIQAEAVTKFLVEDTKAKKIGIFYSNDEMGTAGAEIAKKYCDENGVAYVEEAHATTDTDFTTQLLKFKEAGAEALFIWTPLETIYATVARQMYDLGFNVIGAGAPGLITTSSISNMQPEWIEGWFSASDIVITNPDTNVQEFIKRYQDKFGADIYPDQNTAGTYMATKVLAKAIEAAGATDHEAVRKALMEIKDYPGVLGSVNVNEHGEFVNCISIGKIKEGKVDFAGLVTVGA